MNKSIFTVALFVLLAIELSAQRNERAFIFDHSLIHHELQVNATPSQETSIPH